MARITLVRHGQASFGKANYDELSPRGRQQASELGKWWQHCGRDFDAAWCGDMQRQKDTGALALAERSVPTPEITVDDAFDEYSTETLVQAYTKVIHQKVPELRDSSQPYIDDPGVFFRMLSTMHECWSGHMEPTNAALGFEPWRAFCARIMAGLDRVAEQVGDGHAVIFTSGGVISLVIQQLYNLEPMRQITVNWRVANSGMTEVLHHPKRGYSLLGFNATPHLDQLADSSMLTYR